MCEPSGDSCGSVTRPSAKSSSGVSFPSSTVTSGFSMIGASSSVVELLHAAVAERTTNDAIILLKFISIFKFKLISATKLAIFIESCFFSPPNFPPPSFCVQPIVLCATLSFCVPPLRFVCHTIVLRATPSFCVPPLRFACHPFVLCATPSFCVPPLRFACNPFVLRATHRRVAIIATAYSRVNHQGCASIVLCFRKMQSRMRDKNQK